MEMNAEWKKACQGVYLRVIGRQDGVVRVTRDLSGRFRDPSLRAACISLPARWNREEKEEEDTFTLGNLQIQVNCESGALSFIGPGGETLLRERQDCPVELEETVIRLGSFSGETCIRESVGADGARTTAVPEEMLPDRTGVRGKLHFEFREGEALYGFGSHEEGFGNLRGHRRILYQHNLKAVVPVLVSTAGWAVLFDMGCMMEFHDDAEGSFLYIDCADAADWYFVYGNGSYSSLMKKLRTLTGAAPLLPKYALGFIQSKERYVSADELISVAAEYRRRKIPLDMIVQDWQSWPEGQWGLKQLDRSRFPKGFVKKLHAMHVKVMLSIWPNLQGEKNPDREELIREGCMLGNRSTYNAFEQKAREIYWSQIREGLLEDEIDAWWCDCTEPFESDWHGERHPGDEERMRLNTCEAKKYLDPTQISLYSLCHSRGIYVGSRGDRGLHRVLNLTRSSWAGQHRFAAVTWSGDVCADWETLRRHIPEGLNFMVTGEPWWSCDIGGFFTDTKSPWFWKGSFPKGTEDPGYRELFVRWMQVACFLTLMRAHGTDTPREIWQFGEKGEPFYDAVALCIRMRYRLMAYLYSLMGGTWLYGIPAVRIPALVFPEDPQLREVDYEMMLGDQLLVCPVTRPMYYRPGGERIDPPDETTEVYLPAGHRWYTPDGRQCFEGGQTVTVQAPLERIPVFVRSGSVLPVQEMQQYADEDPDAVTEILVYPGEDGRMDYYNDDGTTYDYEEGEYQRIPMQWLDTEGALILGEQEGRMVRERRLAVRRCGEQKMPEIRYTGERQVIRF